MNRSLCIIVAGCVLLASSSVVQASDEACVQLLGSVDEALRFVELLPKSVEDSERTGGFPVTAFQNAAALVAEADRQLKHASAGACEDPRTLKGAHKVLNDSKEKLNEALGHMMKGAKSTLQEELRKVMEDIQDAELFLKTGMHPPQGPSDQPQRVNRISLISSLRHKAWSLLKRVADRLQNRQRGAGSEL